MSRSELLVVIAVVVEVTAFLAYLAGYDAARTQDEHRRLLDLDPIEALRGD